jgi:hypothetical protein
MTWIRNRPLGLVYHDRDKSCEHYTLFCSVRGNYATLIDWDGRIVHRWHHPEGIQHAHMIENGNLLIQTHPPADAGGAEKIGGSAGAIVELDWDSQTVWEYRDPLMHHAYQRLPSGNNLVMKWQKMPPEFAARVQGGHHHDSDADFMWGDIVQEIDPAGDVLHEWRSWEHFDVDEDVICPLESHKEWTHANSIEVTPSGEWLISFRLTSMVGLVDPATGNFTWKWGPGYLSHQHAAQWLENGHILLFDNGCHRRRGPSFSRVVEVDPATKEVAWTYQAPTILGFYSFMGGGADRLPNGNTLITECATGRLFEVTPEGETVWEYVSGFMAGSAFGASPAVHHARPILPSDPRLAGRTFSPQSYAVLTDSIAAGQLAPEDQV